MVDCANDRVRATDVHTVLAMQAWFDHIPSALLVIFRIGGLFIYAPVLGSTVIPVRVRIGLAFMLGLAVYPLLAANQIVSVSLPLSLWALAPLVLMEILFGVIVGFAATLPLIAMQTGGLVMSQQMGLGFAQFYNPAMDDEADILGQILFFMTLAGFLLIGGHEGMLLAVLNSFSHVPLGAFAVDVSILSLISGLMLSAFELALRVAAPLLALIFLQSLAMGFIAKTVPQLNILSLGFPLRILMGLGIVASGLVVINEVLIEGIEHMFSALFEWIEAHGHPATTM